MPKLDVSAYCIGVLYVTVTFQQLPQVHWGFYQPLNWIWLAWVRRKTHSVVWGLMEQRGSTGDNFKELYSHISHHSHMDFNTTPLQFHYLTHDSVERRKKIITELVLTVLVPF